MMRLFCSLLFFFAVSISFSQVPAQERAALIALYNATDGPNWTNNTDWNTAATVDTWFGVATSGGHVTAIGLNNNGLDGTIPVEIGDLIHLSFLALDRNAITGSIPSEIGNCTALRRISLGRNQISGALPSEIGNLVEIRDLLLGDNQISGNIPPEIGNLNELINLYLDDNQLTGSIPTEMGMNSNLRQFNLRNNLLTGSIPASLTMIAPLYEVQFQDNQLSGPIPDFTANTDADNSSDDIELLAIRNNLFQFGDFENQFSVYSSNIGRFWYSPQERINTVDVLNHSIGDNITLTTTASGNQNHYQWLKNGVAIPGANDSPTLILNNLQTSDTGVYYCVITSDIVSGLSLRRNDITLNVSGAPPSNAFITTWRTWGPGASGPREIIIPTSIGETYDYTVDWGDGTTTTGETGDATHEYASSGTYTVSITGLFPRIEFTDLGEDNEKLLSIEQWGDNQWSSMENAFYYCVNMVGNFNDTPDLSNVTSMANMFTNCRLFNSDLNNWDVSNVTDMTALFSGARAFDSPIDSWNVSNVISMRALFTGASAFNTNIGNWNTSNVTDMSNMFAFTDAFNQDINFKPGMGVPAGDAWNTAEVTNMSGMFWDAMAFNQDIGNWNTQKVTTLFSMFRDASLFNHDMASWDVGNVTDMISMFNSAILFNQDISAWNVGNVTSMTAMFANATSFNQNLGTWNVENVTTAASMFFGVTLSIANYDALLIGWNGRILQSNVPFSGGNSQYCAGAAARANMIAADTWTITDGGSASPTVNDLVDQNETDSYTLPTITGTNLTGSEAYYTNPNGTGTQYNATAVIDYAYFPSYPQTLFIFDGSGTCSSEEEFSLTLTTSSPPGPTVSIVGIDEKCDNDTSTVTLSAVVSPAAASGNYSYEWYEQGNTTVMGTNATFDVSPLTSTTYVVVITDDGLPTGSNSGNATHTIDVIGTPQFTQVPDTTACTSYGLPPITGTSLSGSADYNTGTNGSGTAYAPGTIINFADFPTYPVTFYAYDENAGSSVVCSNEMSFMLTLTASITADPATDVTACDSYILPTLSPNNSYWSNSEGTGTNYTAGESIMATTTLFIYADNGGCTDENQFAITINSIQAQQFANAAGCTDYVLEPLNTNNFYYTAPNKGGTRLFPGNSITADTTVYVYAETGTGPNDCNDESSFSITIVGQPQPYSLENVQACENYTLEALPPDYRYYDQMMGNGSEFFAGNVITNNTTLYIYTGMPGCSAETDFNISLDPPTTASELEDVQVCENYVLPEINNGRYFTQPEGQGNELFAFGVIDSTQTIYIYNESGVCTAETDFIVTIDCSEPKATTCVSFPKFFSPNLDGANDFFEIFSDTDCVVNGTVSIYDRYGKLLRQFDAATDNWDGTFNGINLPNTDYWYRYTDNGNGATVKGHFALKR